MTWGEKIQCGLADLLLVTFIDKVELLLTLEGLKPACDLEFSVPVNSRWRDRRELKRTIRRVRQFLNSSGLPYNLTIGIYDSGDVDARFGAFEIGKDEAALERLLEAGQEQDLDLRKIKTGRAFGYPETALVGNWKDWAELEVEVEDKHLLAFLDFAPSQEFWREELAQVSKTAEKMRTLCPSLYQESFNL